MGPTGAKAASRPRAAAAALAAALLALAGCGGEEREPASAPAGAGNGADRAFVAEMVPHHRSAVEMAQEARRRGESSFVRDLAADIVRTQNAEIAVLRREDRALREAGVQPGDLGVADHMKGMDSDASSLRAARPFDRAFLEMMLPHHEGAVTMARAELERGGDPELRALARQIADAQRREIAAMRGHLGQTGSADEGHAGH